MTMSGNGPGQKVCFMCAADVATQPRVKDKAGRYMCKPCYERAMSARSGAGAHGVAGGGADTGHGLHDSFGALAEGGGAQPRHDDDVFGVAESARAPVRGGAAPPMGQSGPCPDCGQPLGAKAMLCTHCGFDRRRGGHLKTRVSKVDAPKEEKEKNRDVAPIGTYIKPAMCAVIGYGVMMAIAVDRDGVELLDAFFLGNVINLAMGVMMFYLCCVLWLGFNMGFWLVLLNFAGIYGGAGMAFDLVDMAYLPQVFPIVAGLIVTIALMMDFLDLDIDDIVIVGIVTFLGKLLMGATVFVMLNHWLGEQ